MDQQLSERAVKGPKRHQAVSGYWHTQQPLSRWCRIRSYLDSEAASHVLIPRCGGIAAKARTWRAC